MLFCKHDVQKKHVVGVQQVQRVQVPTCVVTVNLETMVELSAGNRMDRARIRPAVDRRRRCGERNPEGSRLGFRLNDRQTGAGVDGQKTHNDRRNSPVRDAR